MGLFSDDAGILARLSVLEQKIDMLFRHLGIDQPEETWLQQARAMAAAGRKIQAIKLYRQHTGVGLYEAKTEVLSW